MSELNPFLSASLADDVYALTRLDTLNDAFDFLNVLHGENFTFSKDNLLKGKTGGPGFIKCRTAFGFMLIGKGQYAGHAVILFRGTQYLADWLSNFNFDLSRSSYAHPVHDGFNRAFKSMLPQLKEFMSYLLKLNIVEIHCIGHSLGGALATLAAEWMHNAYCKKPYLYTFGSPRVGLLDFSESCVRKLDASRIFRMYHQTDIVPFLPMWPFIHTPNEAYSYCLPSPGPIPWKTYHSMKKYVNSAIKRGWGNLGIKPEVNSEEQISIWLKSYSPIGLTIKSLNMLSSAISYVINKCDPNASRMISSMCNSSFSILDKLSYILYSGYDLVSGASSLVVSLIRKMMQMVGYHGQIESINLTQQFIRFILVRLHEKVSQIARSAIDETLAKGRGI